MEMLKLPLVGESQEQPPPKALELHSSTLAHHGAKTTMACQSRCSRERLQMENAFTLELSPRAAVLSPSLPGVIVVRNTFIEVTSNQDVDDFDNPHYNNAHEAMHSRGRAHSLPPSLRLSCDRKPPQENVVQTPLQDESPEEPKSAFGSSNKNFEGRWDVGVIEGHTLTWNSGRKVRLAFISATTLRMDFQGGCYTGGLQADGSIRWDDGDTWFRPSGESALEPISMPSRNLSISSRSSASASTACTDSQAGSPQTGALAVQGGLIDPLYKIAGNDSSSCSSNIYCDMVSASIYATGGSLEPSRRQTTFHQYRSHLNGFRRTVGEDLTTKTARQLAKFVQTECSFMRIQGYTLIHEEDNRCKRRGIALTLRFYVRGLPWAKRAKWLQPLLRAAGAVLQKKGISAAIRCGELFAPLLGCAPVGEVAPPGYRLSSARNNLDPNKWGLAGTDNGPRCWAARLDFAAAREPVLSP